jgi:hypothetical protein
MVTLAANNERLGGLGCLARPLQTSPSRGVGTARAQPKAPIPLLLTKGFVQRLVIQKLSQTPDARGLNDISKVRCK